MNDVFHCFFFSRLENLRENCVQCVSVQYILKIKQHVSSAKLVLVFSKYKILSYEFATLLKRNFCNEFNFLLLTSTVKVFMWKTPHDFTQETCRFSFDTYITNSMFVLIFRANFHVNLFSCKTTVCYCICFGGPISLIRFRTFPVTTSCFCCCECSSGEKEVYPENRKMLSFRLADWRFRGRWPWRNLGNRTPRYSHTIHRISILKNDRRCPCADRPLFFVLNMKLVLNGCFPLFLSEIRCCWNRTSLTSFFAAMVANRNHLLKCLLSVVRVDCSNPLIANHLLFFENNEVLPSQATKRKNNFEIQAEL